MFLSFNCHINASSDELCTRDLKNVSFKHLNTLARLKEMLFLCLAPRLLQIAAHFNELNCSNFDEHTFRTTY
jgi:hypothetical protein